MLSAAAVWPCRHGRAMAARRLLTDADVATRGHDWCAACVRVGRVGAAELEAKHRDGCREGSGSRDAGSQPVARREGTQADEGCSPQGLEGDAAPGEGALRR